MGSTVRADYNRFASPFLPKATSDVECSIYSKNTPFSFTIDRLHWYEYYRELQKRVKKLVVINKTFQFIFCFFYHSKTLDMKIMPGHLQKNIC